MSRKSHIWLGPGAPSLILIFVVLSMAVLAMLSLLSAKNDLQLSRRSAEAAEMVYRLREAAEEKRAAIGRRLAEGGEEALNEAMGTDPRLSGLTREGDQLAWTETDGVRTLHCAVRLDAGAAWMAQRLTTNIGEDTALEMETAAKLALADAILARQKALEGMLERCAQGADNEQAYLARVAEELPREPAAEGVSLEGKNLTWVETDGVYSYACSVVIHPLDAEHRSDFAGIPVLLPEENGENENGEE